MSRFTNQLLERLKFTRTYFLKRSNQLEAFKRSTGSFVRSEDGEVERQRIGKEFDRFLVGKCAT